MQDVANFIGELGGDSWTTQAVAISLGAFAALITALVAFTQAHSTRRQERELKAREQWWDRFKSVVDDLGGDSGFKKDMALALLENLADARWASPHDRKMVVTALAQATRSARKEASER